LQVRHGTWVGGLVTLPFRAIKKRRPIPGFSPELFSGISPGFREPASREVNETG